MRADQLYVVAAYANPMRWKSRERLAREFAAHMLDSGVNLTIVDCAFGERPHDLWNLKHVRLVKVRARGEALIWNKESILNVGISRLPESAKYIGTFDADITFRRPDWAAECVHALQMHHVAQPWQHAYDLGPNNEHMELHHSFCSLVHQKKPIMQGPKHPKTVYKFGHPGYSWLWRRSFLDAVGGLVETAGLGAGDHHMALALIGKVKESIPHGMTDGYVAPLLRWQERALHAAHRNIGFVPGTIAHNWHGPKTRRFYIERWETLVKHRFDPAADMLRNTYGVLELDPRKPGLRHDIALYFESRNEDSNDLG